MLFKLKDHIGKVAVLIEENNTILAKDIIDVLLAKDIEAETIEITNNVIDLIDNKKWQGFSRVFLGLSQEHCLAAGHIQGLLEHLALNYTGSGMLAVALSKDLIKTKKIWQAMGIATIPFIKWGVNINWQEIIELFGLPLAIRSVGSYDKKIFKVLHLDQLREVCQYFTNLNEVIIEPYVTGDDYIAYIINDRVLLSNANQVATNIIKNMQKLAKDAFMAIGGQGIGSVALIKDLSNDCWVQSVNTMPSISQNSNLSKIANDHGINWELLVEEILATSFIKKISNHFGFSQLKIGYGEKGEK